MYVKKVINIEKSFKILFIANDLGYCIDETLRYVNVFITMHSNTCIDITIEKFQRHWYTVKYK